jgi:hypothetical protein
MLVHLERAQTFHPSPQRQQGNTADDIGDRDVYARTASMRW